jgi:hypothetical protein
MSSSTKPVKRKSPRPAKPFAPARVDSTAELADLQRAMWRVVSRPLTGTHRMQRTWSDGRPTSAIAAQIAKPNDRLTSFERLEIYNRMYWFRVLDSLYDDCPGLRGVLGDRKFMRLAEAYLTKYPSRSFTLRNLPSRLAKFIKEEPQYTRPHTALCLDLAHFEWARVEVFDTAARPLFTVDDLLDADPTKLRLNLQPYLQLLALSYPVDDYILEVKKREAELLRGDASNATSELRSSVTVRLARPRPARTFVAVHRMNGTIYFKRLDPAAYKILTAIRAGKTLEQALSVGIPRAKQPRDDWAAKVQSWFANWMQLGWFCRAE